MLNKQCMSCACAIRKKLTGISGDGVLDECEYIVYCENARKDIFIHMMFMDNVEHNKTDCPYFISRDDAKDMLHAEYGEHEINIAEAILYAVYKVKPEIVVTSGDLLVFSGVTELDIPYAKHGEAAMNIVDVVLGAVYDVRPEVEPTGENSLLYGDPYYHIEEVIGDIIQACIDEKKEPEDDPVDAVTVYTDDETLWVNSGERCEIRISGLKHLKGIKAVKAVMYKSDNIKDVMILG